MIKTRTRGSAKYRTNFPKNNTSLMFLTVLILFAAATFSLSSRPLSADTAGLSPSTDYRPQEVVRIVIDALQNNSAADDDGIATVFRFASPGNRNNTGPLSRFTRMIKGGFPDMLNHAGARYDPMEISEDTAIQAVWLLTGSGAEVGYAFQLGRQRDGEFENMWMTEVVVPLGPGPRSGTRI